MIPKILHHIRVGTDVLPPEAAFYQLLWRQLHPGWEHVTWTPRNLPPMANRDLFDRSANTGHRSDLLRLEVLHRFGGVYVDLDVLPQKPLDPLLDAPGFLGRIPAVPREACVQRVETAVMAAEPGNPFVGHLLAAVGPWSDARRHRSTSVRTGPQFVQAQLDAWAGPPPVTLHPPGYFYPYLWHELDRWLEPFPDAYAIHRWWGTWRRQGEGLRKYPERRAATPASAG